MQAKPELNGTIIMLPTVTGQGFSDAVFVAATLPVSEHVKKHENFSELCTEHISPLTKQLPRPHCDDRVVKPTYYPTPGSLSNKVAVKENPKSAAAAEEEE